MTEVAVKISNKIRNKIEFFARVQIIDEEM